MKQQIEEFRKDIKQQNIIIVTLMDKVGLTPQDINDKINKLKGGNILERAKIKEPEAGGQDKG